ncbi:DUF488 domain-containing protein [Streptomyces varsoviensis]|uniref:MarR family transcriptional regulator n=1 Tax=Streptomyces varsoviensis TaxID=67373 RepID=A0ABR5IUN6_9ACTN|nr:DUF488 family protein [Streptomyces varsoviensis]KOG76232.1 hypothetical protein ADK38_39850 [Streptomyces varsoviensis]
MARDTNEVRVRRVYDAPAPADGTRVLVDRLWPRGLSKAAAELDEWDKDVAPSDELRRWYGHDPDKFDEFAERYRAELAEEDGERAVRELCERAGSGRLTLLTATKDVERGHVVVLAEVVRKARGART